MPLVRPVRALLALLVAPPRPSAAAGAAAGADDAPGRAVGYAALLPAGTQGALSAVATARRSAAGASAACARREEARWPGWT